jgi:CRP/FNR family transcriptional regulator, cyclic AMP receptor protein
MAGKDQKLELIRRVPLFEHCSRRDLEKISQLADEVDVPAGKVLIREGATGQEFFIVLEGSLRVEQNGTQIGRMEPGDFFGEIALVDGGPRTATVVAEVPSRLLVLGHREFHSLLEQNPGIQIQVLQALAKRVRTLAPEAAH